MATKKSYSTSANKKQITNKNNKSKTKDSKFSKKSEIELSLKRNRIFKSIILFMMAILIVCIYIFSDNSGNLWDNLHKIYWRLCGFCGIFIPIIIIYCAVQYTKEKPSYRFKLRAFFFVLLVTILSIIIYAFSVFGKSLESYGIELQNCYDMPSGLVGGLLGIPSVNIFGSVGTIIIGMSLFIVIAAISLDILIIKIFNLFKKPIKSANTRIKENIEDHKKIQQHKYKIKEQIRQNERKEYVKNRIDKINNKAISNENKKNIKSDFCKPKSSPFYVPQKTKEQSLKHKQVKAISNNGDDTIDMLFGIHQYESKEDKNEISVEKYDVKRKLKNVHNKDKKNIPKNIEQIELPVFSENIDKIINDEGEISKKQDINVSSPLPNNTPKLSINSNPISKIEKTITETYNIVEGEYIKPPITLLESQPEDNSHNISAELNQNGTMLVETLKSFGVQTTIVNISRGPSVTRYELQPAAGVKISKITNLADDIAMNLAATGVRIEAPIPGKSAVGIEVPNRNVSIVRMRNLIEAKEFINAKSRLTVALGYDITGKIVLADLGKMPHLLIAGSTGSGKSVCVNSMLVSLLYKSNPDEVKLMLIDPKVVELGIYNGIPNLIVPVVTDPKKAAGALNWAVNEMLERYKIFAQYNVRDMHSYNRLVEKLDLETAEIENHDDEDERSFEEDEMLAQAQSEIDIENTNNDIQKLKKMPQIIIIIDELADLMMAAPNEVEESICRLAQMARAAGMHLVIATQRPSVDVITGLIKANIPSRIAFAVKSQIDSRTILDSGGAEKLLGRGDMLFSPIGTTKPIRVQGCYVDDSEIESIINFIKESKVVEYDNKVIEEIEKNAILDSNKVASNDTSDVDPMVEQAIQCVIEAGQASTSLLQRRLRLGYARAGRIIDEMEQMGIIGPHEGSKPRQVLISYQQWLERKSSKSED